ncbi:MAG: putative XIAP-associated factor 1 [Streblomastix strix]|uniref:Putative XIAP-associated factor 1 n=1 Tax=Streblomastix strix TaxID=222440 RepID=A0A5J4WEF4_9EUKA|nr:MAG: putative XIAP-associated factor 1 [Streblomastix strix]
MSTSTGEGQICENCRQLIKVNFSAHELFCRRNIALCPKCEKPFQKNELKSHDEQIHKILNCKKCGEGIDSYFLSRHKSDECSQRIVGICPYCEIELISSTSESHKEECGSRIRECLKCGSRVRVRDMEKHVQSNCRDLIYQKKIENIPIKETSKSETKPEAKKIGWGEESFNRAFASDSGNRLGEKIWEEPKQDGKQQHDQSDDIKAKMRARYEQEKEQEKKRFDELVEKQKQKLEEMEQLEKERLEREKSQLNEDEDYMKQSAELRKARIQAGTIPTRKPGPITHVYGPIGGQVLGGNENI